MLKWCSVLVLAAILAVGCATGVPREASPEADALPDPALSNAWRIDEHLIRCAQPDAAGMRALEAAGVKTVVNLRYHHDDADEAAGTGLETVHIPMNTWDVRDEHVVAFLRTVTDPEAGPVAVHCQHGADRTGVLVAMYRVAVQGWDREKAIAEMTSSAHGFHRIWGNLPAYVRSADVAKLRREAGL
jgi:protein tyrosine/serine phosphatase